MCDRAQDIFKQALQTQRVELRVIFADVQPPPLPAHPPPAFRPVSWRKPLPDPPSADVLPAPCEPNTSTPCKDDDEFAVQSPKPTPSTVTKMPPPPPPSTTSKVVGPYTAMMTPYRSDSRLTGPRSDSKTKYTPFYGARAIGRKLHIQLVKGKFTYISL